MIKKLWPLVGLAGLVAGCVTTTTEETTKAKTPVTVGAKELTGGDVPSGLAVSYDKDADTMTVSVGATSRSLTQRTDNAPGFGGYFNGNTFASRGETTSGAGYARIIVSPDTVLDVAAYVYGRTGSTQVPASGSADYSGQYVGRVVRGSDNYPWTTVKGNANLTADFGSGKVSGTITDRVDINYDTDTFADITLEEGTLTDGAYSGVVSGGARDGDSATGGSYAGLLTGATADETVGGLTLSHQWKATGYTEVGAFIAE